MATTPRTTTTITKRTTKLLHAFQCQRCQESCGRLKNSSYSDSSSASYILEIRIFQGASKNARGWRQVQRGIARQLVIGITSLRIFKPPPPWWRPLRSYVQLGVIPIIRNPHVATQSYCCEAFVVKRLTTKLIKSYDRSSIPFAYFPLEMHMGHSQTLNSKINDKYCFQTNSMRICYISEVQFVIGIELMAENR